MKQLAIISLSIALVGCSSTKRPTTPHVTEIGTWSGPDVALMVEHWDRMCAVIGVDGPTLRSITTITQSYSPATPGAGNGQWGPATCDEAGCWHGIARWSQSGTYHLEWPRGRHEGVIPHELMHPIQDMLVYMGDMPAEEMRNADPPGHPEHMTVNGRRHKTARVVDWRWPSLVEPIMIFAAYAWAGLCGTKYETHQDGSGI